MAGLMATPSKVDKELQFQPINYARDGTPRKVLSQSDYEQRKQLCTSKFLQQVNADRMHHPRGTSSAAAERGPGFSAKHVLYAGLIAMMAVVGGVFGPRVLSRGPAVDIPGASWASIFPDEEQADWSFGCHLTNITKDKDAGLVSFTAHFADLPADAFAKASLKAPFADVLRQQVSELGDYAFNTSEVSVAFSDTEASVDTNVTLGTAQELIVFMGKITSGALAGRLASNRAFRRVLAVAGYTPKFKVAPAAIKNSWLEPMVENAARTQEEASLGMLGYMHKVQKSYTEIRQKLATSEAQQANLTEELQAKSASFNQLQNRATQLQKDLDAKEGELNSKSRVLDKITKSEVEAKEKLAALKAELEKLRKDNANLGKDLERKSQLYQGLQVQHKEAVDRLQMFQGDKSQLAEKTDSLAKDNQTKEKQLAGVAAKLQKVLLDHFNVTADKAAKPDVLVNLLDKQVKQLKTDSKAALDKVQAEADEAGAQLDQEKARAQAELKKAQDTFAATLTQKEKEAASALAAAESGTARAVDAATKQLQSDIKGRDKKLAESDKQVSGLQAKLQAAQQQLQDKDAKIEEQQKKAKSLQDDLAQVEKELKATSKTRDILQSQTDGLKADLASVTAKSQEGVGALAAQDKHIRKLETMIYKLLNVRRIVNEVNKDFEDYTKSKTPGSEPVPPPAPAAAPAAAEPASAAAA